MKRFGVILLLFLTLFHAGTVFAEKNKSGTAWWDDTRQMEVYLQSIAVAEDLINETVTEALSGKVEKVQTHSQTVSQKANKAIHEQKEAYIVQLNETRDLLIKSSIFQSYYEDKKAKLDEEVELETKAILESILMEKENETK